jgi:PhnB protein
MSGAHPMLAVRKADEAIEFYKKAFGAEELFRLTDPSGNVVHAEIKIGEALIMLAEEDPRYNRSPEMLGGTSVIVHIYVPDVDKTIGDAIAAGAKEIFPISDQFYGDRTGRIEDPYRHMWIFSTHREDVSIEEMKERFEKLCSEA